MFVYSANDVSGDVMPYPACLLTFQNCLFYSHLPQTTINTAINNLRKRRNACVSADGGHFEHIMWTGYSA